MEVSYDEEADVLYIKFKESEDTENLHKDNGIVVSRARETGEIVGYTVMYFSEKERVDFPATKGVDNTVPV